MSLYQPTLFALICSLQVQGLLSLAVCLILQGIRGEPQEGYSSSRVPSCSPVSSLACGASAAGVSRDTTGAHSTHPCSDYYSPPCAGPCSSSEGLAEAATSSPVLAEEVVNEGTQTDQFSPESLGSGSW